MESNTIIITVVSGVLITVLGAWVVSFFQSKNKMKEDIRNNAEKINLNSQKDKETNKELTRLQDEFKELKTEVQDVKSQTLRDLESHKESTERLVEKMTEKMDTMNNTLATVNATVQLLYKNAKIVQD